MRTLQILFTAILSLPLRSAAEEQVISDVGGGLGNPVVSSRVSLEAAAIEDQDDMCIWIHPADPASSTIITSDKRANRLFVYDLAGELLQSIEVPGTPGNIDVRHGFPLGGRRRDIVAYNDRDQREVVVYRVEPSSRQLARKESDAFTTGASYGFCLYRSPVSGETFAFTTAKNGVVEQYRLDAAAGTITGTLVRFFDLGGQTEGCVCDDETTFAYFGEEEVGIWRVSAEPASPPDAVLIASVGDESGLQPDVEGLTLYYGAGGRGYLLASSQSIDTFFVYEREVPHAFVKTFAVKGVGATDGIDVTNVPLGPRFPRGIFVSHNGNAPPYSVEVCGWEDAWLDVDTTSWDPRGPWKTLAADGFSSGSWGRHKSAYRTP